MLNETYEYNSTLRILFDFGIPPSELFINNFPYSISFFNSTRTYESDAYNYVKLILENIEGAVNIKDENGQTALHVLCDRYGDHKNQIIILKMVMYGADVNAIDNYGNTPLHCLLEIRFRIFKRSIKDKQIEETIWYTMKRVALFLIKMGTTHVNSKGETPMECLLNRRITKKKYDDEDDTVELLKIIYQNSLDENYNYLQHEKFKSRANILLAQEYNFSSNCIDICESEDEIYLFNNICNSNVHNKEHKLLDILF